MNVPIGKSFSFPSHTIQKSKNANREKHVSNFSIIGGNLLFQPFFLFLAMDSFKITKQYKVLIQSKTTFQTFFEKMSYYFCMYNMMMWSFHKCLLLLHHSLYNVFGQVWNQIDQKIKCPRHKRGFANVFLHGIEMQSRTNEIDGAIAFVDALAYIVMLDGLQRWPPYVQNEIYCTHIIISFSNQSLQAIHILKHT